MKVLKYLLAFWAALAIYSVISLLYGATGIFAYQELLSGRETQWENITKLGLINSKLENAQNSLLYDRDTLAVYARQMGYGYENERFIRIVGLGGFKNPYFETGEIIRTHEPGYISDRIIKMCALFIGTAVFGLLLALEFLRR